MKRVFGLFSSIKMASGLLILLIIACLVGSLKPQIEIYNPHLFMGILVLLSLNIIACSISKKPKRIAAYITHFSILVILFGAAIDSIFGFKAYVEIKEKEGISLFGFSLRLDDFEIEYYPNSEIPKDYKSRLTCLEKGRPVLTKTIEVNHPLVYKGVWFYQADFGIDVDKVKIAFNGKDFKVKIGESFYVPERGIRIKASQFLPDFIMDGKEVCSRSKKPNNPAVKLDIYEGERLMFSQWVFSKFPDYHQRKGYDFRLAGFYGQELTGLQVAKNPGLVFVWIGCGLLIAGIIASIYKQK
ncbi:MAG: cytochrome c biogenesis protein ResB [bacterium]|nr:cytochrome c biogenesis protein ResB [bacterium]